MKYLHSKESAGEQQPCSAFLAGRSVKKQRDLLRAKQKQFRWRSPVVEDETVSFPSNRGPPHGNFFFTQIQWFIIEFPLAKLKTIIPKILIEPGAAYNDKQVSGGYTVSACISYGTGYKFL